MGGRDPIPEPFSAAFQGAHAQEVGLEAEAGLEPSTVTQDTGVLWWLSCTTTPTPFHVK